MTKTAPAVFAWKDEYAFGIAEIDRQHRTLVDLVRDLHEAMAAGKGTDTLRAILDELIRYTQSHFRYEEQMLARAGWKDLEVHKAEHQKLTRTVEEFRRDLASGRVAMTLRVMDFLKSWLVGHILEKDRAYVNAVKAAGGGLRG